MNRRDWIKSAFLTSALSVPFGCAYRKGRRTDSAAIMPSNLAYQRISLTPSKPVNLALNQPYPQLSTGVLPVSGDAIILKLPGTRPLKDQKVLFRLAVSGNSKSVHEVTLRLPKDGDDIGTLDLRYPVPLQVFQVELPTSAIDRIQEQGLSLSQSAGDDPLEIFINPTTQEADWDAFCPHLLVHDSSTATKHDLFDALYSIRTLAPFGWEEGCVTDALWQLGEGRETHPAIISLKKHFAAFGALDHDWKVADHLHSIESTLPFAALAKLDPDHPSLEAVLSFWKSRHRERGVIADWSTTGEGAYTVAYPMTVFADVLNRKDLAEEALTQLRHRVHDLTVGDDLFLRQRPDTKSRSFKNWARAYAWYMLGIIRTLEALTFDLDTSDLREEFQRISAIALKRQRNDGLWSCFTDQSDSLPDTSGSAGIAAAIASGINAGILPGSYMKPLRKTASTIQNYLTPDGLLSGIAQSNKGGLALQESDYRVILAMGAGLLGQFFAAFD